MPLEFISAAYILICLDRNQEQLILKYMSDTITGADSCIKINTDHHLQKHSTTEELGVRVTNLGKIITKFIYIIHIYTQKEHEHNLQ